MRICPRCTGPVGEDGWVCRSCGWESERMDGIDILGMTRPTEGEGFSRSYFQELAALEAGHFWFKARNELITWVFRDRFGPVDSFLEVGCGTGFVLQGIHGCSRDTKLTGSELFLEGLLFAKERLPGVALVQMDALAVPFREEFDAVGAFDVLEHIPEDGKAMEELFKALKPGGHLLLTVPQHPWLWSANDEHARHARRYTRAELCGKVRRAGFAVERTTSFVTLLLPLMALSRFRRDRRPGFDPLEEFRIPAWQQWILGGILAVERSMIKLGLDLPLGGSLLLVGKKPSVTPESLP